MQAAGFTLFDTAIGRCGAAWSPKGLCVVALPAEDDGATARRLSHRLSESAAGAPTSAPAEIGRALEGVAAHLSGELDDLGWIALDHDGAPDLHRRIWAEVRAIPPGRTRTYGEVAQAVGDRALAQAVGQAMGRNPTPIVVPCHRVLGRGGRTGGFSAPGGVTTKLRLLQIEGAGASADAAPGLFGDLPLQGRLG